VHRRHVASGYIHDLAGCRIAPPRYLWRGAVNLFVANYILWKANMNEIVRTVLERSTGKFSEIHGPAHWRRVGEIGLRLADDTPGADREVIFLFALFHDSMRFNDMRDPEHGKRGADLAHELREKLPLDEDRLETLLYAIDYHADGYVSDDPTIGACWDGDRLQLFRVGKYPDPRLLSTKAAPGLIEWAKTVQHKHYEWAPLYRAALTKG
jgi:uncharacterized protein